MKERFLLLSIILSLQASFAQTINTSGKEVVFEKLKTAKDDTSKVLLLIRYGNTLEENNPDSASYYYTLANNLSNKLHYLRGTFKYISNITAILNFRSQFDSSLALNLQSIAIANQLKDQRLLAMAYNNTGGSYYNTKDYEKCISYFLKAIAIFDSLNDKVFVAMIYANVSGIYADMSLDEQSYNYGLKAISIAQSSHDTATLKGGLNNTTSALLGLKKYDSALLLSNQVIHLSELTNDYWTKTASLINNCQIYFNTQQYHLLLETADKALASATIIDGAEGMAKANLFKCIYYLNEKNYAFAKTFAEKAIVIALDKHINDALQQGYKNISLAEFGLGHMSSFHQYTSMSDSVDDIILSDKIIKNTQELDAKYSLNKKQREIDNLAREKTIRELELAQRKQTIYWLAVLLLVIIGIAILNYRYQQQKKKLLQVEQIMQQQKISELENEKLLTATQAVIQGQEEERSRLAKDLHDGLGGILSSTKYSLSNMKENFIITPENAIAFERTMTMLDQSITELRRVAHNMMPETLMKLSLSEALEDFCAQVTLSGALQVNYQSFGTENLALDNQVKITVYRIVQELINNAIKHAGADMAAVQLLYNDHRLNITIEDDGSGFDKTLLEDAAGIGYKNMQSRIRFLKGSLDIQSVAGKGTSVYIEIPLV